MIGLISDTHGLLRPNALAALQGVSQIIHAGDVGRPEVLAELERVAPVTAIRGNVDSGAWAEALPATRLVQAEAGWVYVLHDLGALDLDPAAAGWVAVISGHSHQPRIERRYGVLYINPGSAGPRRFKLPVTVARMWMEAGTMQAELVEIDDGPLRETMDQGLGRKT